MRAITYSRFGDPSVLSLSDVPVPKVAPGAVLIRVHRAAVNPVDAYLMQGALDSLMDSIFPVVPGWDVSGVVEALGPDVPEFRVGDRVAAYARKDVVSGGTFAEFVALPATSVAHVPDGVDFDTAAALPLTGLTALRTVEAVAPTAGETVLIHAASGGVGYLASQLALATGATVIGTASQVNFGKLSALGVHPLAHGEGLTEAVRALAPHGVDAVIDLAGGVLGTTLAVLREGGRHVSITDPSVVEHGGRWLWVRPDGARLEGLLARVAAGELTVAVDRHFPLEEAAQAVELSVGRKARGKLVIDVAD